jgi:hypothetical protein
VVRQTKMPMYDVQVALGAVDIAGLLHGFFPPFRSPVDERYEEKLTSACKWSSG